MNAEFHAEAISRFAPLYRACCLLRGSVILQE
jgi:hypothetical protein